MLDRAMERSHRTSNPRRFLHKRNACVGRTALAAAALLAPALSARTRHGAAVGALAPKKFRVLMAELVQSVAPGR